MMSSCKAGGHSSRQNMAGGPLTDKHVLLSFEGMKTSVGHAESQVVDFTESLLVAFLNCTGSGVEDDLGDEVARLAEAINQLKEILDLIEKKMCVGGDCPEVKVEVILDDKPVDAENVNFDPFELTENISADEPLSTSSGSSRNENSQQRDKSDLYDKSRSRKEPCVRRKRKSDNDTSFSYLNLKSEDDAKRFVSGEKRMKNTVKVSLHRLEIDSNETDSSVPIKAEDDVKLFSRGKRPASQKAIERINQMKSGGNDSSSNSDSDEGLDDEEWGGGTFHCDESDNYGEESSSEAEVKPLVFENQADNPNSPMPDEKKAKSKTSGSSKNINDVEESVKSASSRVRKRKSRKKPDNQPQLKCPCPKCGMVYLSKYYLDNHLKQHEDPNLKPFVCSICSASFVREGHLMIHRHSHGENFACPHCDRLYSSTHTMKAHVKEKHVLNLETANPQSRTCTFCLKVRTYTNFRHFYDHRRRCARKVGNPENPMKGPWRCPKLECKDRLPFSDLATFKTHINNGIHPTSAEEEEEKINAKKQFFKCPKCSESFESKLFRSHIKFCVCLGQQSNNMACPVCQKVSKTILTLVDHIKLHQVKESLDSERPFQCPKCSSSFAMERYLKNHLEMFHKTTRPFLCSKCPDTFKWKSSFIKHMKNLHPDGPAPVRIICDQCGQTFAQENSLAKHLTSVHQGLRPYSCGLCDKTFKQKSHLDYHKKTHENPNGRKRSLNKPKLVPVCRKISSKKQTNNSTVTREQADCSPPPNRKKESELIDPNCVMSHGIAGFHY